LYLFDGTEKCAVDLDEQDELKGFRNRFLNPENTIYLNGNSLGLLSRDSERALHRVLDEWKNLGVGGWMHAPSPWFYYAEKLGGMAADLVGADPDEVVMTGTTTINIHSLIATFFAQNQKRKILTDSLNFPTDIYALKSQLKIHGYSQKNLVFVPSQDGRTIDEKDVVKKMSDDIGLIFLPSVLYRSGQLLDVELLTREANKRGIPIGFDCSHSVGAVPHDFKKWGVDFAVWCSYKYLNGGPGCSAFIYINQKHFQKEPGLAGWFGFVKEKQFDMLLDFDHQKNAGGWQISSPNILGAAVLEGSLKIFREAGIEKIRQKSKKMTSYLIYLVDKILSEKPYNLQIGSPRESEKRGGHVVVERDNNLESICHELKDRNVVIDFRPPNVLRITPAALYNTFHEVWEVVQIIKGLIDEKDFK